ncbi:MAG: UDP-N-acetylmuramate dehydrogenase [Candidatus Levybacteria bacterium]|nr:UDP-N-acetylmuramate dehydrogenase [Candidatus Levybacteria bacterium]
MTVFENFPLSDIIYYGIGGKARFVLRVQNKKDLLEALEFIRTKKIKKVLTVGFGSNLLVSDSFFNGAVLWFCRAEFPQIKFLENGLVKVFAGENLDDVIQFSFQHNLIGLEWAGGLPGTIGGGIRGNVGAFGGEIKNSIEKVEVFDIITNEIKVLDNKDLKFSYRNSYVKENKNLIVVNAFFKLSKANEKELAQAKKIYFSHIDYRKKNHPLDYPSCGSVFKNITDKENVERILNVWPDIKEQTEDKWHGKVAMGYVINRLGFSGKTYGGAQVAEKHANYILNKNNATFNDVETLIQEIKDKFNKTFGFYPEVEVEIIS